MKTFIKRADAIGEFLRKTYLTFTAIFLLLIIGGKLESWLWAFIPSLVMVLFVGSCSLYVWYKEKR